MTKLFVCSFVDLEVTKKCKSFSLDALLLSLFFEWEDLRNWMNFSCAFQAFVERVFNKTGKNDWFSNPFYDAQPNILVNLLSLYYKYHIISLHHLMTHLMKYTMKIAFPYVIVHYSVISSYCSQCSHLWLAFENKISCYCPHLDWCVCVCVCVCVFLCVCVCVCVYVCMHMYMYVVSVTDIVTRWFDLATQHNLKLILCKKSPLKH